MSEDIPLDLTIGNFIKYFFSKKPKLKKDDRQRYLDGRDVEDIINNGIRYYCSSDDGYEDDEMNIFVKNNDNEMRFIYDINNGTRLLFVSINQKDLSAEELVQLINRPIWHLLNGISTKSAR